jgi:hypothetical protein
MTSDPRILVSITPRDAYHRRPELLLALESAFPVRFAPADAEGETGDALVVFLTSADEAPSMSGPTLALIEQSPATDSTFGAVSFERSPLVPAPFRGRVLTDSSTQASALRSPLHAWGEPLATCLGGPVWLARPGLQYLAAAVPAEMVSGELLRERLSVGQFMGLLPLAHFLQELCARFSWQRPASRACLLFDDPNLHWWSYGFFDYRALSRHANAHDYRLAAAAIPLDHWYIHGKTAAFLSGPDSRISFAIHGNNHTREELRRLEDVSAAAAVATQALRRSDAVARAGIEVSPVMVPPHGVLSVATLEGCLRAGFEAVCADWAYWWLSEKEALIPLAGWHPLDRLGGLPLIPRLHAVAGDLDDLVFRAFLGQPVVLYAHHTDLRDGLDILAVRADDIRSLGVETWASLGTIGRDVVSTYRRGDFLSIVLHSRRAVVTIPDGVSAAEVVLTGSEPSQTGVSIEISGADGQRVVSPGERVPLTVGTLTVSIKTAPSAVSPQPGWDAGALVRRGLTEARDRVTPLAGSLAAGGRRVQSRLT